MLRLFFQGVKQWIPSDPTRPNVEGEIRPGSSPQSTKLVAPSSSHFSAKLFSLSLPEKTTKTYGPEGPWIWSLVGPKKFRDSGPVLSISRRKELYQTHETNGGNRLTKKQLSRMRGVGAHEGLGRDGAQTPPFYSAHGFSSTSFTSNFAEGRPLTPGSPILPTSPFSRVTRDVLRGCAGEQRPQRGYADAVIHAPRLVASALSPSRPDTAH